MVGDTVIHNFPDDHSSKVNVTAQPEFELV